MALAHDATSLLQRLIRMNTVNPPGNERPAQEMLRDELEQAGFECELLGATRERPNLVARLRGASEGPRLCYLSHVDTVLADAGEWSVDPWSGEIRDGFVWGRGALDMKGQVACEVAAACALARSGWRPARGELLVIVTCDEEAGATYGAQWLCKNVPEKVRCNMVLNEGAGEVLEFDGRRLYTMCIGEKGVFRFKLTTEGRAGHASMPAMGDNALLRMVEVLSRLDGRQPGFDAYPEGVACLSTLTGSPVEDVGAALADIRAAEPRLDDPRLREGERDPLALHRAGGLPRASGHGSRPRAQPHHRAARIRVRNRIRNRVRRAGRRQQFAGRLCFGWISKKFRTPNGRRGGDDAPRFAGFYRQPLVSKGLSRMRRVRVLSAAHDVAIRDCTIDTRA